MKTIKKTTLKKAQNGTTPDTLYTKKTKVGDTRTNKFVVRHKDNAIEMGTETKKGKSVTKKSDRSMLLGDSYTDEEIKASMNKKKSGGKVAKAKDGKWIQKAVNPKHKGFCTPLSKPTCTKKRKALALTFKKIAKKRKNK